MDQGDQMDQVYRSGTSTVQVFSWDRNSVSWVQKSVDWKPAPWDQKPVSWDRSFRNQTHEKCIPGIVVIDKMFYLSCCRGCPTVAREAELGHNRLVAATLKLF